jgi:DNA-binding NtrC family response regulator
MKNKVLLMDDKQESLIRSLRYLLPPETWELVSVANLDQAVAKLDSGETDLIVMAVDSRSSERWMAIDEITETNPILPVIVFTEEAGLEDLAEAVGARALVKQPVDLPVLVQTMGELLGERRQKRAFGNHTAQAGFIKVASRRGSLLEDLQRRFATSYASGTQFRNWGINE